MGDLDELIQSARAAAQKAGKGRGNGVEGGQLEGLLEAGRARLFPRPGESTLHHAGYLAGHLVRWLHEHGKALDAAMMLATSIYGAAVADAGGQAGFAKPDAPMPVHLYAVIRTEMKTGETLPEEDERGMFGWLLEQSGTPATPRLLATFDRQRIRRLERSLTRRRPSVDENGGR